MAISRLFCLSTFLGLYRPYVLGLPHSDDFGIKSFFASNKNIRPLEIITFVILGKTKLEKLKCNRAVFRRF